VKYFILKKGEMEAGYIIRMRWAFMRYIDTFNHENPPVKEEVNKVKEVLGALIKKAKDKDLLASLNILNELLQSDIHAQIKEQKIKGKVWSAGFAAKCKEFHNRYRDYLLQLINESYKNHRWQLGIDICRDGVSTSINQDQKAVFYSQMARGLFNLMKWKEGFSLICKFCKEKPFNKDFVRIFCDGLSQFIFAWKPGGVDSNTANKVKPLIEEYLLFLKPGEIEKFPEMEIVLGFLKEFISPQVYKKVISKR
jgi:hypothetical protein